MNSKDKIALAIHGGAGIILRSDMTPDKEKSYLDALKQALDCGFDVLENGGSSLDAVETCVTVMEDCPFFNAGRGSVFSANGTHEMDASIMDGSNTMAGAVCGVEGVRNPIQLARAVMEKSGHVMLAGRGAEKFARQQGLAFEPPEYFYDELRYQQWQTLYGSDHFRLDHSILPLPPGPDLERDRKFGTVGAVALDAYGNLAAATSTGGMTNKKYGRVGDSPIIGAGTYANNATAAVSCTGSGELFIRAVAAYDVSSLVEHKGMSLQEACREVVHKRLMKINGDGGMIAVDTAGNLILEFNTEGMYRGWKNRSGYGVDIYK